MQFRLQRLHREWKSQLQEKAVIQVAVTSQAIGLLAFHGVFQLALWQQKHQLKKTPLQPRRLKRGADMLCRVSVDKTVDTAGIDLHFALALVWLQRLRP